jgi:3-hydroxyisobutyrate dehydrogenase-like beta-hydroxyacid dehydrogenase
MSRRSRKNIGLIGLGIIGRRVAENLRKKGFHVFVWNRTPRPVPNFVGSAAEVAELCHVIQLFVADDEALLEIIRQLSPALTTHHVVVAHSTVSPETIQTAAETVQRRGARLLDAPFTGSRNAAEKGELVYYVAGDDGALKQARRFLEASSKEIVEFGEVGEATLLKIATNMVTAASVQSVAEALALVAKCGISAGKFERALRSNASQSATVAMKLPKMMGGDFEPHFSVKHMLKDLQIAGRLAQSLELEFRVTEAARDAQLEEVKHGREEQDYSCVVQKYFPDGIPMDRKEPASPVEAAAPPAEAPVAAEPAAAVEPATTVNSAQTSTEPVTPVSSPAPETEPVAAEVTESKPETPAAETPGSVKTTDEEEPRRNFFSRLFSRGGDY